MSSLHSMKETRAHYMTCLFPRQASRLFWFAYPNATKCVRYHWDMYQNHTQEHLSIHRSVSHWKEIIKTIRKNRNPTIDISAKKILISLLGLGRPTPGLGASHDPHLGERKSTLASKKVLTFYHLLALESHGSW